MIEYNRSRVITQSGQGMTEYIVILSALVFTFLAPVTPPSVPDWASDGAGSRQLECPDNPYNAGEDRPEQCTVIEILAEVLRKRNDGYTYAISSTYYPERYVRVDPGIFDDPDDPGSGNGEPGDPDNPSGDPGDSEADFEVDGDTGVEVAVNDDGEVIGTVGDDGCVKDDDGKIIGKQVGTDVWETDSSCNLREDDDGNDIVNVIGTVGNLKMSGDVTNEDGETIGHTDT